MLTPTVGQKVRFVPDPALGQTIVPGVLPGDVGTVDIVRRHSSYVLFFGHVPHLIDHEDLEPVEDEPCPHPPTRVYAWHAGGVLCAACCDCGAVLAGGAQ